MIRKYLMYKRYYNAWYRLKYNLTSKYGFEHNYKNELLRTILEYMQTLEYNINSKGGDSK